MPDPRPGVAAGTVHRPPARGHATARRPYDELTAPGAPFAVREVPVAGAKVPVYANGPGRPTEILDAAAAFGDRPLLFSPAGDLTYAGLRSAAAALADRMTGEHGLRAGDRVVIRLGDGPQWLTAFWAAQLAGLVAVPVNPRWDTARTTSVLDHCAPRLVVAEGGTAAHRPAEAAVRAAGETGTGGAEDVAAILYTSGTTGEPKGAVLSRRNLCAAGLNGRWPAARAAAEAGHDLTGRPPATTLLTFPFFHIAALAVVMAAMSTGGTLVVLDGWDAGAAREAVARHRVTAFSGTPAAVLELLLDTGDGPGLDTLEQISTGGAAAPPTLVRRVGERFGGRVEAFNGYGLTETSGRVVTIGGDRYRAHPAAVGAPSPATRTRVVAPDGAECPEAVVGELQLIGQGVFQGYWGDPAATRAAFDGGWFRTGDLAYRWHGEIFLVDRIRDVVTRGGRSVYCIEVEAALFEHPDVADAAVFGVPHAALGEELTAVVVPRAPEAPGLGGLRAHLAARLDGFKVPGRFVLRSSLPRNANGKVLKGELRAELATGAPGVPE